MGVNIILNMIMKNEHRAGVLLRGLETIKHIFQYYAISDTGSDDRSVEVVEKWMKDNGKTGIIRVHPWEDDFGRHRTIAINLAYEWIQRIDPKGEHEFFAMFHDADNLVLPYDVAVPKTLEEAKAVKKFPWNRDDRKKIKGHHRIKARMSSGAGHFYTYTWMVNLGTALKPEKWRWLCCRHEYVDFMGKSNAPAKFAEGGWVHSGRDGARGKIKVGNEWKENIPIEKYLKDAIAIERELDDPTSQSPKPRLVFYLANSYKDAGWWERAAENYQKRIYMGDYMEEVYHSYLMLFNMMTNLGKNGDEYMHLLLEAANLSPHRLEAIHTYVVNMERKGRWAAAWFAGKSFIGTPVPANDHLFVQTSLYEYEFNLKMLKVLYYAGIYKVNVDLAQGKIRDFDKEKFNIVFHNKAKEYRALVQSLLKNDYIKDKTILDEYIRNTLGIYTEEEKSILYKLLGTNKPTIEDALQQGHLDILDNEKEYLNIEDADDGPLGNLL